MPRNPIARPIERAGCRPSSDGGTGAALRGHDRNDGLPPYRPPWKTNNGDLDCWTSCPLGWQNERTAHPGGASEGAGLSPDVSSPLIGRPMGRTRVPPGFHPRRFPCPAVAGVGRRARRAWKLKTPCGSGEPRSTVFRRQLTYLHPVLERSLFPHGEIAVTARLARVRHKATLPQSLTRAMCLCPCFRRAFRDASSAGLSYRNVRFHVVALQRIRDLRGN